MRLDVYIEALIYFGRGIVIPQFWKARYRVNAATSSMLGQLYAARLLRSPEYFPLVTAITPSVMV